MHRIIYVVVLKLKFWSGYPGRNDQKMAMALWTVEVTWIAVALR